MSFLKYFLFAILIIVLYNIFLFILYKIFDNLVKKHFPELIKVCPDCYEEYDDDCDYCSKCGTILVPFGEMIDVEGEEKIRIVSDERKVEPETTICFDCDFHFTPKNGGKKIMFCPYCGKQTYGFDEESFKRYEIEFFEEDEAGEKKKMIDFNEIKLINFLELFEHYEIELDYYWDVSEDIEKLKKQGYSDEEIQEEFSYELEDDFERDLEYSFEGSYNEFLEFIKEYDVYDDVYITDDIIKEIRIDKNNKFIYIKIIRYYYI